MLDRLFERDDHRQDRDRGDVFSMGKPDLGPITIIEQFLEPFIAEALDAVPIANLPDLRAKGSPEDLRTYAITELDRCGFGPEWLAAWLTDNVWFQARLFAELSGAPLLRVRLEAVADNGCTRFHLDQVRLRLLCTFRGPGTEWLDPKSVANGAFDDVRAVRQLRRGQIAVMRGASDATARCPGLLHRSPKIEGSEIVRLLLAIDVGAC